MDYCTSTNASSILQYPRIKQIGHQSDTNNNMITSQIINEGVQYTVWKEETRRAFLFLFVATNAGSRGWQHGSMAAHIQLARGEVGRSSNLVYVNQPPSSLAELDRLYLRFSLSLFFALLVSSTDYY